MYLVSACLCGVNCKYSGSNNLNEDCLKLLRNGEAILVCPEQLGGLQTPRCPAEINGSSRNIVEKKEGAVITKEGADVTNEFLIGAQETVKIAKEAGILTAILKEGSPSCGSNLIYDGNFNGNKKEGEGITAFLLKEAGIDVISDEEYSEKLKKNRKLIYLSDYEFKRKENTDEPDCTILYDFFNAGGEFLNDLSPAVKKHLKMLLVSLAKEIMNLDKAEDIAEVTGLNLEEVIEIINNNSKE